MLPRSLAFLLLFVVSCATTGGSPSGEAGSEADSIEARRAQAVATGKELWSRCQFCHGADGRAQTAVGAQHGVPDFTSKAWRRAAKPDALMASISGGCGPETVGGKSRMPAQPDLSEEEVRALIAYIYSFEVSG